MDKSEVRKRMRALKRALAPEERLRRSEAVMRRLEQSPQFAEARTVLMYWAMDDEVRTQDLIGRIYRDRVVLLPCVDGDSLRLRQYTGPQCMVRGEQFGIGEPAGEEWTDLEAVDFIAVPGVAFDRQGNRMGRGRGFYDRLLKAVPHAYKMGVAFAFQVVDTLPVEPHDVPMDGIVCDAPGGNTPANPD